VEEFYVLLLTTGNEFLCAREMGMFYLPPQRLINSSGKGQIISSSGFVDYLICFANIIFAAVLKKQSWTTQEKTAQQCCSEILQTSCGPQLADFCSS
jgi:hypothetical protein